MLFLVPVVLLVINAFGIQVCNIWEVWVTLRF
jgi:hypothetical protein